MVASSLGDMLFSLCEERGERGQQACECKEDMQELTGEGPETREQKTGKWSKAESCWLAGTESKVQVWRAARPSCFRGTFCLQGVPTYLH